MCYFVGISQKEIPYQEDLWLCGYVGRDHTASGVHDPLHVKAVSVGDGASTVLLISCDLIGVESAFARDTIRTISRRTGIPESGIVIFCTHTHSGPNTLSMLGMGTVSTAFLARLAETILACALEACHAARPATMTLHRGTGSIGVNRVLQQMWGGPETENWEMRNWDGEEQTGLLPVEQLLEQGISPDTHVDDELLVLQICEGKDLRGLLINYACHPVVLEYTNYQMSADFLCGLQRSLEAAYPGAAVLFLNGCCGDINPVSRGGFALADQLGAQLAGDVLQALARPGTVLSAPIQVNCAAYSAPLDIGVDEESLRRRLRHYEAERLTEKGKNATAEKVYAVYLQWAEKMMEQIRTGTLQHAMDSELRLIRMGELAVATLPFEVFHEVGKEIKTAISPGNTMVAAYANGENGYFVSSRLHPYAKYERFEAFKFSGAPGPIAKGADREIVKVFARIAGIAGE